ncbi:unnamed protein product, partial [Rotaria sordida]
KNSIRIAEQNFYFTYWKDNYAREIPFIYKNGLYYIEDEYKIYGWLEIDDSKEQLKPLNKLTIEKIQMKGIPLAGAPLSINGIIIAGAPFHRQSAPPTN